METTCRFAQLGEQWRRSLGITHRDFAAMLGRHESEWSMVRRGLRSPTPSLIRAALMKAEEPWRSALERAHIADLTATDGERELVEASAGRR